MQIKQYPLFRLFLGTYLAGYWIHHFVENNDHLKQLSFNSESVPYDFLSSAKMYLFKTHLIEVLFVFAIMSAAFLAFGIQRRLNSLINLMILIIVLERNQYLKVVSDAYLGWALLFLFLMPYKKTKWPLQVRDDVVIIDKAYAWVMTATIGVSYFASAWTKLLSTQWRNGQAIQYILQLPLTRFSITPAFLNENLLHILTWGVIFIEIIFLPYSILKRNSVIPHALAITMHLSILIFLNFTRVPLLFIILHLLIIPTNSDENYS